MTNNKIIPYLNMGVKITLGKIHFYNVSRLKVTETIMELGDRAVIELPRNFGKLNNKPVLDFIKVGDPVIIEIGYNGLLAQEFTGFISKISADSPLVIECDDEIWPLKQNSFVISAKKRSLKELLKLIAPGYTLDVPEMTIKRGLDHASTYEMLRWIQQEFGLFCRVKDKKLTLGYPWDWKPGQKRHKYVRQLNIRKDRLKWKTKSEFKVRIRAFYMEGKHKKAVYVGDPEKGAKCSDVGVIADSAQDAKNNARAIFEKSSFDGFTGSLLAWGIPRIHAGDSIDYEDRTQPEKNGSYLVPAVQIEYNESNGWTRDFTPRAKTVT